MQKYFEKITRFFINSLQFIKNWLLSGYVGKRANVEIYSILKFMSFASGKIKKDERVLDAGAGKCPYRQFFVHARYESTDFEDIFDQASKNKHTFICSLDNIPKPDNHYDAIINTQVLEHVEFPQKVINEFYRILKPNGKLFLTAPQGWGIHGAPYHFYGFTYYGLKSLFKNAGFKIIFIKPEGGIFWYLGNRIRLLPTYLMYQYLYDYKDTKYVFKPRLVALLYLPIYLISIPICEVLVPFIFFFLDRMDYKKEFTLGYKCFCKK